LYGISNKCAHDHATLGFPRAHVWDLAVCPGSRDNFPICDPGPVAGAVGVRVRPPRAGASSRRGPTAVSPAGYALWLRGVTRPRPRGRLPYKPARAPPIQTPTPGGTPAEARAGASSVAGVTAGYAPGLARAPRLQWLVSGGCALGGRLARASRPAGGILETVGNRRRIHTDR
jgi:hypothetical protein